MVSFSVSLEGGPVAETFTYVEKSCLTGKKVLTDTFYLNLFLNESHQWELGRNVFIINVLFCSNNFTFVSMSEGI